MNKNLQNIPGYFKIDKLKNDRQLIVFLVCLLIASALWFLNALSKDYSTTVSYPVKYVNPPKNEFLANELPDKLDLKVDAHGFTLLRHKLSLSFSPIVLNLSNITKDVNPVADIYTVNSKSLIRRISEQVSNEITITDIQPEVLKILFDSLKSKSVPVKSDITIDFKPQYKLKAPVYATPENVKITGPSIILDSIDTIRTDVKTFSKVDANLERMVDLIAPEKTSVMPPKVKINIEVEKFTEKELTIPIQIKNKPDNVSVKLFPSEVKVVFTVGLSEFDKIKPSDFEASVDFNSAEKGSDNIVVTIDKKPEVNQLVRFSPERVEFLIETN